MPIKASTIQDEVAKMLRAQNDVEGRKAICEKILFEYPDLNFSKWYEHLKNIVALGELHITKVDIVRKSTDRLILKVDQKKGSKVKLRIYFSPKPSAYEQLKKVKVLMMNGDGYYEETELCTKKVSENAKDYRDISFVITDQFVNGTYFFHVCAIDEDGTVLNINDHFQDEATQKLWEKEKEKGADALTKEEFQQLQRKLLTSDSEDFFLEIKKDDDDDPGDAITRMKINNVLQAYFRYRIELNRKGQELTIPQRVAVPDKSAKTSDDELKSWQYATHIDTFQLRYDKDNNYQIPLSKKLLQIESAILKNNSKLGYVDAVISDNYTDESLKSCVLHEIEGISPSESLIAKRTALFEDILDSAPGKTGVIETYEIFNHISEIKDYLEEYHSWLKSLEA